MNEPPHYLLNCQRLPGRVDADGAAALLGFKAHDLPVLISEKLLKPLGKPGTRNAKWFAAVLLQQHAADAVWLDKATRAINENWRERNGKVTDPQQPEPATAAE